MNISRLIRTVLAKAFVAAIAAVAVPVSAQINAEQVLRIGQNALYFEDYMLSIQYFNQAIQAKPYQAKPYLMRAIAKLNLDDYRGAEADASKAIELNPFLPDAWEVRGVARSGNGRTDLAIGDYTEALKLLPRNRSLLLNRAIALSQTGKNSDAREAFSEIIHYYPGYDRAYLGRAGTSLALKDTASAETDIDTALTLNPNEANGYIMRGGIAGARGRYADALGDIDRAIRLLPREAPLYINRAYLRYMLDSYTGAMADYDYALSLEPLNRTALFNRGLLLMEVNANDLALEDFNSVLRLDPDDVRALYNRAIVLANKGRYDEAIGDISRVAQDNPDLPEPYYMRANWERQLGRLAAAEADYKHGKALAKALPSAASQADATAATSTSVPDDAASEDKESSAEATRRRFASLLTVDRNTDITPDYNNTAIRGRVQDRRTAIDIEPPMLLSFYSSPTELRGGTCYIREVDDLNATRSLRFVIVVTNHPPTIDENMASRHFQSIEYYNSYLATHKARPVDYIGRAMDLLTVRDYSRALLDARRAVEAAPNLPLPYFVRAQASYGLYQAENESEGDAAARRARRSALLDDAIADYRKALELSPQSPVTMFNIGCLLFEQGDYSAADKAFTNAIELKSDFGEAYYNRGYVALRLGQKTKGIADLSKAGELGIIDAYSLIKRIEQ